MRYLILLFLAALFLLPQRGSAQLSSSLKEAMGGQAKASFTITGMLKDTGNFSATGYASISLIRSADSILQTFTRADEQGSFNIEAPGPGKYLLLVSHPSFAIFIDEVTVDKALTELDTIVMTSKKQMLDEVVITDARAIVIKGDTIEYAADSFKVRAYDNVDELLKKLPGIEVSRNGKIKAYGKEVQKMTVDGEEFFSDDPAVVAQTLRAAAVDKVQVFDKKSDQAAFTGVDDGELTKTINLKLKDDAKRGYFGKIGAGGGLPAYWENQAMINAFKKKRKLSAYALMSNTNTNGLGWEDRGRYSGSNSSFSMDDDAGYMVDDMDMGGSWDGQFGGQGLPKTWTGGAHYSNKWMGDTLTFSSSYNYNKNTMEGINNSRTQYILPDTQYTNTNNSTNTSVGQQHNLNVVTEFLPDTASSVKLTLGGRYNINDATTNTMSTAADGAGKLMNDMNTVQQNHGESKSVNASLLYRRRFRKKGRSISVALNGAWSDNENNGLLNSYYNLYAIDSAYRINQRKATNSEVLSGSGKISYTEPLSKIANLELNYGLTINNNNADNSSYDKQGAGGETDLFNPEFSSHYVFNSTQHQGGANLRFKFKTLNLAFGGNVSDTRFRQEDKLNDTTYAYSYVNFFPRASLTFNQSQTTSFNLRYNGSTRQPTISQLQPLRNNTDPLNVALGNPDLKQEFRHNFNFSFNTYKVLTSQSVYAFANLTMVQNAISQQQNVDETGRRTYQYVNVNGNYNAWLYLGYGRKLIDNLSARLGGDANFSHANNFINGLSNTNNQLSLSPNLNLRYDKDTTMDISYSFRPTYNLNQSSIRTDVKTQYWAFEQQLDGSINLPFNVRVGTSVDWNIRQRLDQQDKNNNVFRWNAYVSKSFLKDRSLVAKVYAYDILDQNIGYTRTNNADYIAESTYNTIRRYFLLSLTWNFTSTGSKAPAEQQVIIGD
ncbi:outer membrane beta-barrel family protein [Taibaiella koreensis]|uniref:outer membrane beta-barrel family protein n=1 Tax=Taibaiella koreensis TaxID=1268548 RepID=UPI0013C35628|nr:outer membrane beta-barrel family protein [Taibaiella koreensis]